MSDSQINTTDTSQDSLKNEYDKKVRELRTTKRDLATIVKENQKLQSELRVKTETINSLINQNFTELKSLQEKHDKIVNSLTTSYENNIKNLDDKYKTFKQSLQSRVKDNINTHYKLNNERISMLISHNKQLSEKIEETQKEMSLREEKIKQLINQHDVISNLYNDVKLNYNGMEHTKNLLEEQLKETKSLYENQTNIKIEHEKTITGLALLKEKLESELHAAKQELSRNEEITKKLSSELDHSKISYQDIHHKHILLLNDNVSKQNSIDEKTLEILSLNSKLSEIEKKNALLESNRKELNVKITEMIHQIDNLQSEIMSAQKIIHQLKTEKDVLLDEKLHYVKEADQYKQKMIEIESSMLDKIKQLQDIASKDKEKYTSDNENKLKELKDKHEKQIMALRSDLNGVISDREKQIDGLTSHLKSYTDNQHILLNEMEKIKLTNEKLRMEHSGVDQKTNELHVSYKKELDELRAAHKKEKDILVDSYNENIKKSQELNDALQNRLNQTIEALGLSKTAISNLKETNQNLERQIQSRESEDGTFQEKYNQLKSENLSLREKLERSIDLNNTFSNKEKQYEMQIKQLQNKYNQLVALTKKSMNSISQ
ncbi:putative ORFan [Tupanvirus deep ocean]|uniref:ORFan n=2 Tax=Tupanvirus TaxID=2094720 RepID=A0AC62A8L5_9VIRU|nr:putative ORFan [Tupanvirus deep ocean]QKU34089.1 putative ORFan [Tupanvirus deep ocean]